MNTALGMECPQRATPKLCVQAHADMNKGSSNNYGCGITLHGLYLGSWARAQEGELLLESTFCASQHLQWHCQPDLLVAWSVKQACSVTHGAALVQRMPLVGGTRQRLGLPSGRWIRPDRSRSPRSSAAQGGHDAGQSCAETGEVECRRYVSGLYMENGRACWPWECVLACCKLEETGPFTERCLHFPPGLR